MTSTDNLRMLHHKAVEARGDHVQAALGRIASPARGDRLTATQRLVAKLRATLTPGMVGEARAADRAPSHRQGLTGEV